MPDRILHAFLLTPVVLSTLVLWAAVIAHTVAAFFP